MAATSATTTTPGSRSSPASAGNFMAGADLKTYIPQITELHEEIGAGEVDEIDGCQLARRHRRRAAEHEALQADHRRRRTGPAWPAAWRCSAASTSASPRPTPRFGVMEPKRGLFAGGGTTVRLPRQLAFPAAMEFLLTAEALPGRAGARARPAQRDRRAEDELLDRATDWAAPHQRQRPAGRAGHQGERAAGPGRRHSTRRTRSSPSSRNDGLRQRGRQGGPEGVRREARRRTGRAGDGGRPALARASSAWPSCVSRPDGRDRRPSRWPCGSEVRAGRRPPTPRPAATCSTRSSSLQVVYCQSWQYDDPPGRLAERARHRPRPTASTRASAARRPQVLVDDAAEAILAGDLDVGVVCGAEALDTKRRLKKAGERPAWSHRDPERKPFPFEAPFHPAEVAHEVFQAWLTFPLCDVARRAHLGVDPDEYRRRHRRAAGADDRGRGGQPLRLVPGRAHAPRSSSRRRPRTAWSATRTRSTWCRSWTSTWPPPSSWPATRRPTRLGVPAERRVYLRGWAYAHRPGLRRRARRPVALAGHGAACSRRALGRPGVGHRRRRPPRPVQLLRLVGALRPATPSASTRPTARGVTVTGGLPFAGGAGSDYLTHSIADDGRACCGTTRARSGWSRGVGMHMTKHVAGVYSTEPGPAAPVPPPRRPAGTARRRRPAGADRRHRLRPGQGA